MRLANAGNVVIPAIKLLRDLGFSVRLDRGTTAFTASKDGHDFTADDPVAVLGLVRLFEARGELWRVGDTEWESIGKEFGLL